MMKTALTMAQLILLFAGLGIVWMTGCGDDDDSSTSSGQPSDDDDTSPNDVDDDDESPADDDSSPVDDDDASPADDDDSSADDDDDDTYTGTKYPIVLMHGFFGWGEAGPFSYFAGVVNDLTALGYEVSEPAVSPINSIQTRADQWVEAIEAVYGDRKINIIAHSQGGCDARYMISSLGWGDRVGALVTVATPHYGSAIADVAMGILPGFGEDIIDWIMNMLGMDLDGVSQLTHDYMENEFNPANPDDPRVAYYSYQTDAEDNCYFLLEPTHWIISLFDGANDGVVPTASGIWGTALGVQSADHWSIIGQPAGFANFDHQTFYRNIAQGLRDAGF